MNAEAEAAAHRALVAVAVAGLIEVRRGLCVVVDGAGAGEDAKEGCELLVMTDRRRAADADVAEVMARARAWVGEAGVVAVVVSSVVTSELVGAARDAEANGLAPVEPSGAYARALGWARERDRAERAPPVNRERLALVVEAAARAGLTLVEPESGLAAPSLARVTRMKSPRARALLATIALGASARPMLFVPSTRAPKGGLARVKLERLADAWIEARSPSAELAPSAAAGLAHAALAVLDEAARDRRGPLPFKELLREARARHATDARAHGARATASASDARDLASLLYRLAAHEAVRLYAVDPADPGWTLTRAPSGLSL